MLKNIEKMDAVKSLGSTSGTNSQLVPNTFSSSSNKNLCAEDGSNGNNNSTAGEKHVTLARLQELIEAHKEWLKYIVFDGDGNVLLSNVKPLDGEVSGFLKLFNKREDTMASGIVLLNEQYDVHRFHPPLVYGRRGDPSIEEGEGIAVCRVAQGSRTLFCLITYVYPTLSARAVPQLKDFCETHRKFFSGSVCMKKY
ncbi:hypothetical protein PsorP6_010654 [Peronosclerospora sorghi]|uniref:Uncharacterized protein n=1 Tax=Peronosclerospora sorghi TaxID=230839 RepID=A0ACC0VWJ1_9STRA|nr:hypothetical protein PsorP6_010654 [Peronosclerospora sorghi]